MATLIRTCLKEIQTEPPAPDLGENDADGGKGGKGKGRGKKGMDICVVG